MYRKRATPEDSLSKSLNAARKLGSCLCDIEFQVDGQAFPAHKAVLAASSSVFMVRKESVKVKES